MQTRYTDGPGASLGATQLSKCHTSQSLSSPSMTENNSSRSRAQAEYQASLGETETPVLCEAKPCGQDSTAEGMFLLRSWGWDFEHQLQDSLVA